MPVEPRTIYRLLTWTSPSYPVGAYSYSHGLEQAVEAGLVTDAPTTAEWLAGNLEFGAGFTDTVFLVQAHGAACEERLDDLVDIAELASAYAPTAELALETRAQGQAFVEVTSKSWPATTLEKLGEIWKGPITYPVAFAVAAAAHDISARDAAHAYLHGFSSNLASAAVRLVPLGQTDGQRVIAGLEDIIVSVVERAERTSLDEMGGAALMTDICSMAHETQRTRLFRS